MRRRTLLSSAAASAVAAPAIVRADPVIRWTAASSYPRNLDVLFGTAEEVTKRVAEASDGAFQIRLFAAGEIVPALQVLDAVQAGTVQCGQSIGAFYVGKDPTFAFDTALPFGLDSRQQTAWMSTGPGRELMAAFLKGYNVARFAIGDTGAQMGGWFRREIKSLDDLSGLKMRIAGLGGQVLARLGVVPQQIAGGDVYPALEKGTIDAVEWVGPYDDEKLGFHKIAKHYYYPGWWEGSSQISLYVNLDALAELPKRYRAILENACAEAHATMTAKYDVRNVESLRRLIAGGAQLHPYPRDILTAAFEAAFALYEDEAARNPAFRTVYEVWRSFREEQNLWFRVAEQSFNDFVFTAPKPRSDRG